MVPKKKLNSIDFIKTNEEWEGCLDNIGQELKEMRVDYDSLVKVKPLDNSSNRLLQRRLKLRESKLSPTKTSSSPNLKRQSSILSKSDVKISNLLTDKITPITALYYSSNLNSSNQNKSDL